MTTEKRLIDANALKKYMCLKCNDEHSDEPCEPSDCVFCNAINDAPTVDAVEVVHGKWKDARFVRAYKATNVPVVQCSECECYFCDIINNHHFMYHYCPNCVAKMDGDGDG